MRYINANQSNLANYISKVPNHTKLQYHSPMATKTINSPPQQASLSDLSESAAKNSQFEEDKFKDIPKCFKNYANRSNDSSFHDLSIDEGFATKSVYQPLNTEEQVRINLMPVSLHKPLSRAEYVKPKSMLVPTFKTNYLEFRRSRAARLANKRH